MKTIKALLGIVFILATIVQTNAQTWLTNGLVAYYPFNGNANDASGNGNNGAVNGATLTADRFGRTNSAYAFAGSASSDITINSTNVLVHIPFSCSLWVDFTGGTGNPRFMSTTAWEIGANWNGTPRGVNVNNSTTSGLYNCPSVGVSLQGNWHQIVAISSTNSMQVYVDGSLNHTVALSGTLVYGGGFGSSWLPTIGSSTVIGNGSDSLAGSMDDVRIYNRALSSNEVASLYAEESALPIPQITTNLTNVGVVVGSNATFAVTATSSTTMSYQWYFTNSDPARVAGAYAEVAGGFVYNAMVTNGGYGYGVVPSVSFVGGGGTGATGYATVSNGVVVGIKMTSAGNGDYTSVPSVVIGPPNGLVYGQTNSTLSLTNVNEGNEGGYYVVVSNDVGSVTSSTAVLSLLYPPAIVTDPVGFLQPFGSSNILSVLASGTAPFDYQWTLNGTNLAGATFSDYTISNLDAINTGDYAVMVSNPYGSVTSSIASVFMTPSLTAPFTGAISLWGQPTILTVGAAGSGTLTYQWYFNSEPISGANGSSYELSNIQFTNAGLYSVVVSSIYGSVTNAAYQVVVNPADVNIHMFPGVMINGTPGYTYNIQSTTNLADPNSWVDETNLTLSSSFQIWSDYGATNQPQKYYRVQPGQ